MTSITPVRARDITFEFNNSCNCCRPLKKRPLSDDTPMYVHASGEAELFSVRKTKDELESIRRSISVLREIICENSILAEKDIEEVSSKIENEIGTCLHDEPPPHVTLGTINKIKTVIDSLFYGESAM